MGFDLSSILALKMGNTLRYGKTNSVSVDIGTTFPPSQKPAAPEFDGYDIDILHATADDVHAYIDEEVAGKPTVTKEILGKDASGKYDIARYTYAKNREYIAWVKDKYPKMYAWKNGNTVKYTRSVSPRIGEKAFDVPYIETTTTSGGTVENFTNLKDQCAYKYGERYSLSGGAFKAITGSVPGGSVIVPVPSSAMTVVLRFKGIDQNSNYPNIYGGATSDKYTIEYVASEADEVKHLTPDNNGVYTATFEKGAGISYIIFCTTGATADAFNDFIITLNEPIEYGTIAGEEIEGGTPITAVSATNRSRTIGGVVYVRSETNDVEPTVIYTDCDDDRNGNEIITHDGATYKRYPLGDLGANRTKLTPIFIYANEHGNSKDLATNMSPTAGSGHEGIMPALVASRFMRDLCAEKQEANPFYKYIRDNCMVIVIPVANPFGFNYHLTSDTNTYGTGYYNANGCNINRNYDTPGWDVMNAAGNDAGTMGAYVGSENETQYIMNTMVESGARVAMSLHGFWGWQGYCLHQGQNPDGTDYSAEGLAKVGDFLKTNYGYTLRHYDMNSDGTVKPCANMPDVTSKSPSYITQCGAYGGIIEFTEDDVRTPAFTIERNGFVIESAYAQLLNLLAMWLSGLFYHG